MRSTKQILEWLGGLAIIASLLLVAYEIRQNTNALSAQAIFDLNQSFTASLTLIAADADYSRLFRKGDEDPDSLDDDEWYRYEYAVWADLNNYDSAYAFYAKGILSADELNVFMSSYCVEIQKPGYEKFLSINADIHIGGFQAYADGFCNSDI